MSNKCMISQPMNGLSEADIMIVKDRAVAAVEAAGYEVKNSYYPEYVTAKLDSTEVNIPVHYLAKAIDTMAECKAVYFCKGWNKSRGCIIEHEIATRYGYTCLYEK